MPSLARPYRSRPGPRWRTLVRALVATAVVAVPVATAAAPLATMAPVSTLVAVRVAKVGASYPALARALDALDTSGAGATLTRVAETLASAADGAGPRGGEAARALRGAAGVLKGGNVRDALRSACPELAGLAFPAPREALLGVSATSYAPLPAALVLLRLAPDAGPAADDVLAALAHCYGSGAPVEQDGVDLQPLAVAGATLTVARIDDVVAAASSEDLLRAVVRLAHGSSEPSLAARLPAAVPALRGDGVGVSIDTAGIADLVASLPGVAQDATAAAARARLRDALRTVPQVAARLTAQPQGLVLESWTRVDPNGGDPALAALLRCDGCRARPSLLVPAGAWSVDASPMRLQAWATYLDALVRDVAAAGGGQVDPMALVKQQTGLDLEADLFPWIGTEATSFSMPAPAGTPQALVGGAARVSVVPVASADRARAGLARLGPALEDLVARLQSADAGALRTAGLDPHAMIAVRQESYRDVPVTRIQIGPGTDLGVALVGSRLVTASPSAALRNVIDTFRGGPTLHAGPLADALAAAPNDARAVWASDQAAMLHAGASMLRALSQPAAFALQSAMIAAQQAAGPGGATPPDLGTLLGVTELPAEILDTVAAHLGTVRGWSRWQDGVLVRRCTLPID